MKTRERNNENNILVSYSYFHPLMARKLTERGGSLQLSVPVLWRLSDPTRIISGLIAIVKLSISSVSRNLTDTFID